MKKDDILKLAKLRFEKQKAKNEAKFSISDVVAANQRKLAKEGLELTHAEESRRFLAPKINYNEEGDEGFGDIADMFWGD